MKSSDTSRNNSLTLFLSGDGGIDQVLPHSVDPALFERYAKSARQYVDLATRHSGAIPNDIT